jgi:hypothetical protein
MIESLINGLCNIPLLKQTIWLATRIPACSRTWPKSSPRRKRCRRWSGTNAPPRRSRRKRRLYRLRPYESSKRLLALLLHLGNQNSSRDIHHPARDMVAQGFVEDRLAHLFTMNLHQALAGVVQEASKGSPRLRYRYKSASGDERWRRMKLHAPGNPMVMPQVQKLGTIRRIGEKKGIP